MPRRPECVLRSVLRLVDVTQERQGQNEHDMLESPNELGERVVLLLEGSARVACSGDELGRSGGGLQCASFVGTAGRRRKNDPLRPIATMIDRRSGRTSLVTWRGCPEYT